MTREVVVATLRRDNPQALLSDISMYADTFMDYRRAQDNISENGTVVAHPRTGQPMENPYLKVKSQALVQLLKFKHLRTGALWAA